MMIWSTADRSQGGPGYPSTPSKMHPKIMLYAKENIRDYMKHSGQKPGVQEPLHAKQNAP